jgi:hypothetical protein
MEGPLPRYRKLVREGELNGDPLQQMMLEKLQLLWVRLGTKPDKPNRRRTYPNRASMSGAASGAARPWP